MEYNTPQVVTLRFVQAYYKLFAMGAVKTKAEFSSHCALYRSNFRLMEKGGREASLNNICAMLDYYRISPAWLFKGEGDFLIGEA